MLARPSEDVRRAAERCVAALSEAGVQAEVVASEAAVGGGTFPETALPSWAVALGPNANAGQLAAALRDGAPAVIGRIVDDRLLLDLRTVPPAQEGTVVERVVAVTRLEADA